MCLSPIKIRNQSRNLRIDSLPYFHDTTSLYIEVPCGSCSECLRKKQMNLTQRIIVESFDKDVFFGTLTYNQDSLPQIEFKDSVYKYADIRDFQNMMKRLRKYEEFTNVKYLVVTEYGGRTFRPHFHFLLFMPKSEHILDAINREQALKSLILRNWARNVGTRKNPHYKPLCTYVNRRGSRNFDLQLLNPQKGNIANLAFYVSKYTLKYDPRVDKMRKYFHATCDNDDYNYIWSKLKPRVLYSKNMGVTETSRKYVRDCIDKSVSAGSAFPYFISPIDGGHYPMSPYLFNKFGTIHDRMSYYFNDPSEFHDGFHYSRYDLDDAIRKSDRNNNVDTRLNYTKDSFLDLLDDF